MIIETIFLLLSVLLVQCKEPSDIYVLGIEPNSGPVTGETRVLVRLKDFDTSLIDDYPHPTVT